VDLPIENGDFIVMFHSYGTVYRRVNHCGWLPATVIEVGAASPGQLRHSHRQQPGVETRVCLAGEARCVFFQPGIGWGLVVVSWFEPPNETI